MSSAAHVTYEVQGSLALITLDNPKALNTLSLDLQRQLRAALARVHEEREVRAVILRGSGRAFCVGADLNDMRNGSQASGKSLGAWVADTMEELTNRIVSDLRSLPVPVLAAVNGVTAGAGCGLALAADVVIAARSASFLLPFMPKLGILPDLGLTWFLPNLLGRSRSMALCMLDERLTAQQAEDWGLIWRCVEDDQLHDEALRLGERLAALPSHAAMALRQAFAAAQNNDLEAQLGYEREQQRELLDGETLAEGALAFFEKRAPCFRGR